MSRDLPAMASFAELVRVAAGAAAHRAVEGSRRNARAELESRYEMLREGSDLLASLPAQAPGGAAGAAAVRQRPSA